MKPSLSHVPGTKPFRPLAAAALAITAAQCFASVVHAEPNAQMKEVLDTYALLSPVPVEKTTPAVAKLAPSISSAVKAVMLKDDKKAPPFTGTTENFKIPVGGGEEVDARAYVPSGNGPFPTILFIHGGGWVLGSLDAYDASPRALCEMTKAVVISTDYRLSPKYKFPTAHDDTVQAYKWVLDNAGKYKGDPKKVAVAGESAGGNMAASICLEARKQNIQQPVYQLLVYPVANYDFTTPSYQENATTKPLSAEGMKWFFSYYLDKPEDGSNPRISVLQASDFKGLPPATIIAAEIDPLRSEGKAYADKLQAAGVKVDYQLYKGVTHEFFGMGAVLDEAKQAETVAADDLKAIFAK